MVIAVQGTILKFGSKLNISIFSELNLVAKL